jgi:hypothetical protein
LQIHRFESYFSFAVRDPQRAGQRVPLAISIAIIIIIIIVGSPESLAASLFL